MNYLFKLSALLILIPLLFLLIGMYLYNLPCILGAIFLMYFLFFFFRVPKMEKASIYRNPILSPSFGTVKDIKVSNGYIHVIITLSLFDPHVQYVPYNGIIRKKIYKKGSFKPAYFLDKSQYNERMITMFDTNIGDITVAQIAGMITRRIHNFGKQLQIMQQRQHLGFICFGSRVDILFPNSEKIKLGINVGEKVRGGETVIAYTS